MGSERAALAFKRLSRRTSDTSVELQLGNSLNATSRVIISAVVICRELFEKLKEKEKMDHFRQIEKL